MMPGRRTDDGLDCETLAITTAMYGRKMAPAAHTASHQPRANTHSTTQTKRIPMVSEYLIMRPRRSSSGDRGREVIDCCFAMSSPKPKTKIAGVCRVLNSIVPATDQGSEIHQWAAPEQF